MFVRVIFLFHFRPELRDLNQDLFEIKVLHIQYVQTSHVFLNKDLAYIQVNLRSFRPKIKELLYRHTTQLIIIQRIHQMEGGKGGLFIILHKLMFICSLSGIISVSLFYCFLSLFGMQKRAFDETDYGRKRSSTEKKQRSFFCHSIDYRWWFQFLQFSIG